MDDTLGAWRREFPILERTTYLVSHSLGAMPRSAKTRLAQFADEWAERGVRAWAEGWWDKPVTTGNQIGRLIGAPSDSVVMHQNVSVCESVILSCFDFSGRRNKIVYEELNFPSVMYVYEAQRAVGARIHGVPSDDGISVSLERMCEAIDEETLLVPISHVLFRSGFVQDVAAIVRRAHAVGALVIADLYQSAGCVPIDVTAWDVDFATGGSVKWLCGGPGAGYLYVAPRLQRQLSPRMTGWRAHARPFAFEPGPIEYAEGAARFLHGTPAVAPLYAAEAGYDIVEAIGVEAIRQKATRQTELLIQRALELGFTVRSPRRAAERSSMVIVDVPDSAGVARELIRREILIDHRPGAGIRFSPHFYTTDDEILKALDAVRAILEAPSASGGTRALGF